MSVETRLRLIRHLSDGEQCVAELMEALDAAQSRLSFHLKILKTAGLVVDRKEGRRVYYSVRPGAVEELLGFLSSLAVKRKRLRLAYERRD